MPLDHVRPPDVANGVSDVPDHLRQFLPERPEPMPKEQFDAYLVEHAGSERLPRRISWRERWRGDAAAALAKRMPGAAALEVVAGDETGELEGVTILGQWGEVPKDFAEGLQGG